MNSNSILDLTGKYRSKTERRFWLSVEKTESCWLWEGARLHGYGSFSISLNGKYINTKAHRVSYELIKARIPNVLVPDHLCRNRACVNPEHLELVTIKENILRGIGRAAINARKTHCKNGHALTKDNLDKYSLNLGIRRCKICTHEWERNHPRKKRNPQRVKEINKRYRQKRRAILEAQRLKRQITA